MGLLLADHRKGDRAKAAWCYVTIHQLREALTCPRAVRKPQLLQEIRTRTYCEFPWVKRKAKDGENFEKRKTSSLSKYSITQTQGVILTLRQVLEFWAGQALPVIRFVLNIPARGRLVQSACLCIFTPPFTREPRCSDCT